MNQISIEFEECFKSSAKMFLHLKTEDLVGVGQQMIETAWKMPEQILIMPFISLCSG